MYYIYLTTNLVNNKKYIGLSSGKFKSWYKGSGNLIKQATEKYGKVHFSVEVLEWTETKDQAYEAERKWIIEHDALNSNQYYNLHEGGRGGDTWTGRKHTEETKQKLSKARMGRPCAPEAIEASAKNYIVTTPEGIEIMVTNLKKWSRDHGLDPEKFYQCLNPKTRMKTNKGYKVRKID